MSWKEATIGDLVSLQRGHDLTDSERKPGNVPVIGSAGQNGFHSVVRMAGPGVTMGRSGGSIGKITFVKEDYWPHNTCIYVTDFKGNDPRFVAYFLQTKDLAQLNSGSAQPSLNRNFVYTVKVKYPDPATQQKIAGILSAYDDLIDNNRKRIALLEKAARLLYEEWFVRLQFPGHEHTPLVDGVPEGWTKGRVADFYDTSSGGTPSRANPEFYTGEINWVKTQEMFDNYIFDTEEKITEDAIKKSSAKVFPSDTVIVSIYGGTNIGRTAILAKPSATNQACCALLPLRPYVSSYYTALYFQHIKEKLVSLAQGAAQTNISQQVIRNFKTILPSQTVLSIFSEYVAPSFAQIKNLQQQNQKLQAARDLLLPRLMSGELAV